jgi:citrate synthase
VAEWLWAGTWPDDCAGWADGADEARAAAMAATAALPGRPSVLASLSAAAVAAGSADPMRNDRSSVGVAVVGRRLLTAMVAALGAGAAAASRSGGGVAAGLAAALAARSGVDPPGPEGLAALEAAMVVMADHEIAASTLAVRVAASFGADPYAAVVSGLGAVGGTRHGGASVAVHGLLRDAEAEGADVAVGDRLGVGERTAGGAPLPGFGMDLYPGGDPRGAALLERVLALPGPAGRRRAIEGVLAAVAGRDIAPPNCDFGLGALAYLLGLGREAGEAVFVVARTAGWLAHAAEEYRFRTTFRVRAAYTGPRPPTPGPGRPAS